MRKNINVIQIKGIRGLILAGFVVSCLAAGFIVFPGWVAMNLWNIISSYTLSIPAIGLIQGVLLWGIIAALYFLLRKEKVVVCMKSPQGLSEEELKAVFADIKHAQEDPILQAMMKARETKLKIKTPEPTERVEETKTEAIEVSTTTDTTQI